MTLSARLFLVLLVIVAALGRSPAEGQTVVSIGSGFNWPDGVAVDAAGNVFVADTRNNALKKIEATGGYTNVDTLGTTLGPLAAVALDGQGNMFVADQTHDAIKEILQSDGYQTVKLIGSGFSQPGGIAVDGNGNVFVADSGNNAVKEIVAAGGYATVKTLGSGFDGPASVALDSAGNVFVADTGNVAVKEILAAGDYAQVVTIGRITITTPVQGFVYPLGVAVDRDDNVFVVGTVPLAIMGGVYEFVAKGGYSTVNAIGSGSTTGFNFEAGAGVAVDSSGNVFVAGQYGVQELLAAGSYTTVTALGSGFNQPVSVALDSTGNVFVAESVGVSVKEILQSGGYTTVKTLVSGVYFPAAITVDGSGNVFVPATEDLTIKEYQASSSYVAVNTIGSESALNLAADSSGNVFLADLDGNSVKEALAADGYATIRTLADGFHGPYGVAVDAKGNVFVADDDVYEILAVDGSVPATPTVKLVASGTDAVVIAVDGNDNIFFADGLSAVYELPAATGYAAPILLSDEFLGPRGIAVDRNGNVFVADTQNSAIKEIILTTPPTLLAAVLPGSRAVQQGTPATVFASMVNSGPDALTNCQIALLANTNNGVTLSYQTTDPATNAPTGTPDTPATIPGNNGTQTFVLSFQDAGAVQLPAMPLEFTCGDATRMERAPVVPGVDTVDLTISAGPTPDIIALAATPTNNGIVDIPIKGAAAFAVASVNAGIAAPVTVSVDTGAASLPATVALCQTDPATAACLEAPAPSVTLTYAAGATPTFSVFLQASEAIPLAPAQSRVYVRFKNDTDGLLGSTSVAVEAQ